MGVRDRILCASSLMLAACGAVVSRLPSPAPRDAVASDVTTDPSTDPSTDPTITATTAASVSTTTESTPPATGSDVSNDAGGTLGKSGWGEGGGGWGTGIGVGSGTKGKPPSTTIDAVALAGPGTLQEALVRKIVRANLPRIQYCYLKAIAADASLAKAKVTVRFVIDAKGGVVDATIDAASTTLGDPAARACVKSVVGTLDFPPPSGGSVLATMTIAFARGGS